MKRARWCFDETIANNLYAEHFIRIWMIAKAID
jgi:hypothetical protein